MPTKLYNKITKRQTTLKTAIKNGFLTAPQNFDFDFVYDKTTKRIVSDRTAIRKLSRRVNPANIDDFITPFSDYSDTIEQQVNAMLRANRRINQTTGIITQLLPFNQPQNLEEWRTLENNPLMTELTDNIGTYIFNAIHALDNSPYDTFTFKIVLFEKITKNATSTKTDEMLEPNKFDTPEKIAEYLAKPLYVLPEDINEKDYSLTAEMVKLANAGVPMSAVPELPTFNDDDRHQYATHTLKQVQFSRLLPEEIKMQTFTLEDEFTEFEEVFQNDDGTWINEDGSPVIKKINRKANNLDKQYNSNLSVLDIKRVLYEAFTKFISEAPSVNMRVMIAGYFYIPSTISEEVNIADYLERLRAYSPNVDRKFHKETVVSTTFNKICTYETFYFNHIVKDKKEWFKQKQNVVKALNKEPEDIKTACIEGAMIKAYCLLSVKYNEVIIVQYKGEHYYSVFDKGEHTVIKDDSRDELYNGRFVGYYHKQHIAPALFSPLSAPIKNKSKFCLRPSDKKTRKQIDYSIYTFDFETLNYINEKGRKQVAYILCYTNINDFNDCKVLWGENCIVDFIDWIENTSEKTNVSKTKANKKITKRIFYAHNGAKFDFLFIYKELYARLPSTKAIFAGSAIKTMTFYNNTFLDSCLILPDKLDKLAKSFNIPLRKLTFPYNYITRETVDSNINVMKIPKDCWGSLKERDTYIMNLAKYPELVHSSPFMFNVRDYTAKYCMADCVILAQILKLHFARSNGEINGRAFNTMGKMTVAQECKTVFQQAFLEETLYPSPEDVIKCERDAFKGGRTEVFKKEFNNRDGGCLNYYDINSSYPASMMRPVPVKFLKVVHLNCPQETKKFIDHNLYNAVVSFPDSVLIPNLLYRTEKKNIISIKNLPKSYHWGVELNHAIKLGASITVYDVVMYEAKAIFKGYVEHFYAERQKAKKAKDDVMSNICKLRLNNLYGIFALKPYTTKAIVKTYEEFIYLSKTKNILDWDVIDDTLIIVEYIDETFGENIGSLVRLSSYITSLSRSNLAEFMLDCGHDSIYYCDTDSAFTSAKPSADLISDSILGKWKRENEHPIIDAKFLAPKTYSYRTCDKKEGKCKGIPKSLIGYADIEGLEESKGLTKTIKSMFMRDLNGITIIEQSRTINTVYNKREWTTNGSTPYTDITAYNEGIAKYNGIKKIRAKGAK